MALLELFYCTQPEHWRSFIKPKSARSLCWFGSAAGGDLFAHGARRQRGSQGCVRRVCLIHSQMYKESTQLSQELSRTPYPLFGWTQLQLSWTYILNHIVLFCFVFLNIFLFQACRFLKLWGFTFKLVALQEVNHVQEEGSGKNGTRLGFEELVHRFGKVNFVFFYLR